MFYAQSTGGFYTQSIHGDSIPADAVQVTKEEHESLLSGQSSGLVIKADADGKPYLSEPDPLTPSQIALREISLLEASVTSRRIREAALGIDGGWLKDLNGRIESLRGVLE